MSIRVVHDLDLDTLSRVLMVGPPARATSRLVSRAITATLVDLGVAGALRQYRRLRHAAVNAGALDEHRHALAECRDLLMRCYPPRPPRQRRPAPQPQGRQLIDVVFDEPALSHLRECDPPAPQGGAQTAMPITTIEGNRTWAETCTTAPPSSP